MRQRRGTDGRRGWRGSFGFGFVLVLLAALVAPVFDAGAQTPETVTIGVFSTSLPLLAAQSQGFFAREGLTVRYAQVTSSTQQFQSLRDGQYDMITTSPDNIANYRLNSRTPLGMPLDVQIVAATDNSPQTLFASPGITSLAQMRNKTLGVDAVASGFAYVAYRALADVGLERDRDYKVVSVGGTNERYAALMSGQIDAALLSGNIEQQARDRGYVTLKTLQQIVSPYLTSVFAARASWLQSHRDTTVKVIRAYRAAAAWSFDPANREAALGVLTAQPNTSRAQAEGLYMAQADPATGTIRSAAVDTAALENVLRLRNDFGGFETPQDLRALAQPGSAIYDGSFFQQATAPLTLPATGRGSGGADGGRFALWAVAVALVVGGVALRRTTRTGAGM